MVPDPLALQYQADQIFEPKPKVDLGVAFCETELEKDSEQL